MLFSKVLAHLLRFFPQELEIEQTRIKYIYIYISLQLSYNYRESCRVEKSIQKFFFLSNEFLEFHSDYDSFVIIRENDVDSQPIKI